MDQEAVIALIERVLDAHSTRVYQELDGVQGEMERFRDNMLQVVEMSSREMGEVEVRVARLEKSVPSAGEGGNAEIARIAQAMEKLEQRFEKAELSVQELRAKASLSQPGAQERGDPPQGSKEWSVASVGDGVDALGAKLQSLESRLASLEMSRLETHLAEINTSLQAASAQSGENIAALEAMVAQTKLQQAKRGDMAGAEQHGAEVDALMPLMQELIGLVHQRLTDNEKVMQGNSKYIEGQIGEARKAVETLALRIEHVARLQAAGRGESPEAQDNSTVMQNLKRELRAVSAKLDEVASQGSASTAAGAQAGVTGAELQDLKEELLALAQNQQACVASIKALQSSQSGSAAPSGAQVTDAVLQDLKQELVSFAQNQAACMASLKSVQTAMDDNKKKHIMDCEALRDADTQLSGKITGELLACKGAHRQTEEALEDIYTKIAALTKQASVVESKLESGVPHRDGKTSDDDGRTSPTEVAILRKELTSALKGMEDMSRQFERAMLELGTEDNTGKRSKEGLDVRLRLEAVEALEGKVDALMRQLVDALAIKAKQVDELTKKLEEYMARAQHEHPVSGDHHSTGLDDATRRKLDMMDDIVQIVNEFSARLERSGLLDDGFRSKMDSIDELNKRIELIDKTVTQAHQLAAAMPSHPGGGEDPAPLPPSVLKKMESIDALSKRLDEVASAHKAGGIDAKIVDSLSKSVKELREDASALRVKVLQVDAISRRVDELDKIGMDGLTKRVDELFAAVRAGGNLAGVDEELRLQVAQDIGSLKKRIEDISGTVPALLHKNSGGDESSSVGETKLAIVNSELRLLEAKMMDKFDKVDSLSKQVDKLTHSQATTGLGNSVDEVLLGKLQAFNDLSAKVEEIFGRVAAGAAGRGIDVDAFKSGESLQEQISALSSRLQKLDVRVDEGSGSCCDLQRQIGAMSSHLRVLAARVDAAAAAATATAVIGPGVRADKPMEVGHGEGAGTGGMSMAVRPDDGAIWKRLEGFWDSLCETQESFKAVRKEVERLGRTAREWGNMQADIDRLSSKLDGYFGVWTEESEGVSTQLRDLWKELLTIRKTTQLPPPSQAPIQSTGDSQKHTVPKVVRDVPKKSSPSPAGKLRAPRDAFR